VQNSAEMSNVPYRVTSTAQVTGRGALEIGDRLAHHADPVVEQRTKGVHGRAVRLLGSPEHVGDAELFSEFPDPECLAALVHQLG
jgi:hypothetical protein